MKVLRYYESKKYINSKYVSVIKAHLEKRLQIMAHLYNKVVSINYLFWSYSDTTRILKAGSL